MSTGENVLVLVINVIGHHRRITFAVVAIIGLIIIVSRHHNSGRIKTRYRDSTIKDPTTAPVIKPFIYVYALNDSYHKDILAANPDCEYSMFGSEVALHQSLMESPYRTSDIQEAQLFYIPVYASCYLTVSRPNDRRLKLDPHRWQRRLIKNAINHIRYDSLAAYYWQRFEGADHIITASHDFGSCLSWHDNGKGGEAPLSSLLRHVIWLQPNGDYHNGSSCFKPDRDIVIPPRHAFTNLKGATSVTNDNTNMHTDIANVMNGSSAGRPAVYFRGTIDWKWHGRVDHSYSHGIRRKMADLYQHSERYTNFYMMEGPATSQYVYARELRAADFCLCPRGYAGWSPRLVDALLMSCIPVVIADATMLPLSSIIPWDTLMISMAEADAIRPHLLASHLATYNQTTIHTWKQYLRDVTITLPALPPYIPPLTLSLHDAITYPSSSTTSSHSVVDVIIAQLATKALARHTITR